MSKETLYLAALNRKTLPTQEYDDTKRYRMYYREKMFYRELINVDGEWADWEDDSDCGSFDYIYAAYQARVIASDLKDTVLNTLFYECDQYGNEITLLMGIHVPFKHIWRINKSSSGYAVTLRDMTCVDSQCKTWPILETKHVENNYIDENLYN